MTEGREPTRRQVLAGLGGIGAVGSIGGATLAGLTDTESASGQFRAGQVEVDVHCHSERCRVTDDQLTVEFETLEPGTAGRERIVLSPAAASNPVRLWLRTDCPPTNDPLGETLELRLSVVHEGDATETTLTDWRPMNELRWALSDGIRLDGQTDCLDTDEALTLVVEYRLPEGAAWTAGASTTLALTVFAQQCRHVDGPRDGVTPFDTPDCPTVSCSDCVELGKLEVENDRLTPGTRYRFDERFPPFDGDDHTYELAVVTVTDKVDDDERETVCASIRLLKDGSEAEAPPMCAVRVAGGKPDPGNRTVDYEITPPLTRTRGAVCAARDTDSPDQEPDGKRPAISNVVVAVCTGEGVNDDGTA